MYDQDAAAPLQFLVYSSPGVLANATNVTITITLEGTVVVNAVTVAPTSTGTYNYNGPTTAAGRYAVAWKATGTNATAKADQYDVRSNAAFALLSLADAKQALNIPATYTTDDEEIRDYLDTVTDLIERRIGPVIPRAVTETVTSSNGQWALSSTPVISLTSITGKVNGLTTYLTTDLNVRAYSGVIYSIGGYAIQPGYYSITYQAGRTGAIPPRILQAARVLLQHLWRTQRGGGTRPGQGDDDTYGTSYTMPNRVLELLRDDLRPGFA